MNLEETINVGIQTAIKARAQVALRTLRATTAQFAGCADGQLVSTLAKQLLGS